MVKKLKKMAEQKNASAGGLLDSQLAQSVRDSAQQIWLAGMGAFSKAQQEGGKVFESLVKEGSSLQRKTQAVAEERIGDVATRMTAMAEGVTTKAGQQWDKLETIFEQRVSKALGRLGVPTSKEVDELVARIDALAAEVSKLSKTPRAAKTAARTPAKGAAAKANGAKPAAKRAPRKSTAG
jgi:poly(hydroxyalkanoate) granule-associated protein